MSRAEKGPAVDAADQTPTWEYVGDYPRVYPHIPVTVDPGDIVEWPECPGADGCWKSSSKPATRRPDNAPKEA